MGSESNSAFGERSRRARSLRAAMGPAMASTTTSRASSLVCPRGDCAGDFGDGGGPPAVRSVFADDCLFRLYVPAACGILYFHVHLIDSQGKVR